MEQGVGEAGTSMGGAALSKVLCASGRQRDDLSLPRHGLYAVAWGGPLAGSVTVDGSGLGGPVAVLVLLELGVWGDFNYRPLT